ncbi:MAG: hypothetical protein KDD28_27410, partial [Phaeodactylibacter sp.]|nr:hypothetical protein [Phaeodactylibacter sp.]
ATTIKLRPREAALSTGDSLLRQASAGEESSPVDFSGFSKSKGELEVAFRQAPQLNLMTLAWRPALQHMAFAEPEKSRGLPFLLCRGGGFPKHPKKHIFTQHSKSGAG